MDKHLFNAVLKRKGITQEEFAKKLGVTRMSLCNRLNGKVQWNLNEIKIAESYLKLSEDEMRAIFFA